MSARGLITSLSGRPAAVPAERQLQITRDESVLTVIMQNLFIPACACSRVRTLHVQDRRCGEEGSQTAEANMSLSAVFSPGVLAAAPPTSGTLVCPSAWDGMGVAVGAAVGTCWFHLPAQT